MTSPRSTRHDSRTLLPKPMTALDPKSWAYESITRRWPEIARRIFIENELPFSIKPRLEALIADIPDSYIRFIDDPDSPDAKNWNRVIGDHLEKNWLELPWFFTEHYFYRRVIEAIGYFQNGDGHGLDPFVLQKKQGLELSRTAIRDLVSRGVNRTRPGGDRETLTRLLYLDLWGNQADLSMWPVDGESKPDHRDLEKANAFLLEDRAAEIADYFFALPSCPTGRGADGESVRIDFIIDNAGFELVSDLVFADYLVSSGLASVVRFHVKPHPTYVSDATVKDVRSTLDFFQMDDDAKVKAMGVRLADYWDQSKLQVRENFFWTSPLPGWDLPSPLKKEFYTM